ncbi:MAG: MotA/TolQ/ExbB proton channel family protein [Gammaproteobacteria bacterium]
MNNAVCWAIVVLALCCYQTLWLRYLRQRKTPLQRDEQPPIHGDAHEPFHRFSTVLISALPLLGLLGTMMGLLDCFATIANGAVSGESMSRGIADALLSTQLGLLCAIPRTDRRRSSHRWVRLRPGCRQRRAGLAEGGNRRRGGQTTSDFSTKIGTNCRVIGHYGCG